MNLKSRLDSIAHLLTKDRMVGYTTMIAKSAIELGATMLTHNTEDARRVERAYGITAASIDVNQTGKPGFFVIDHFAVAKLLQRAAAKIDELEKENESIRSYLTLSSIRTISIRRALKDNDGDVEKVAKEFAMTTKALRILMKDLGL